jgi:hypothetical protein
MYPNGSRESALWVLRVWVVLTVRKSMLTGIRRLPVSHSNFWSCVLVVGPATQVSCTTGVRILFMVAQ